MAEHGMLMSDDMIVRAEEWPFGLRCADCDIEIVEGERYSTRLEGMIGDTPVTVVTCVACGTSYPSEGGES